MTVDIQGYEAVRECLMAELGTPNVGLGPQPTEGKDLRWVGIRCPSNHPTSVVSILNILDQAGFSDRVAKGLKFGPAADTPRLSYRFEMDGHLIFEDLNVATGTKNYPNTVGYHSQPGR